MRWPVVPLATVADTALGKMLDKGKPRGLPLVPYLRNINVQWGRVDTDDVLSMELADEDRERFGVVAGDLLICEGGEPGRCAIWQGSKEYMAFQKALHRVRPHDSLDSRFLRYLLQHHASSGVLARFFTGSTIAHLPQQQLRRLPILLPPVEQQRRIVEILEDHLSHLDAAATYESAARSRVTAWRRSSLQSHFGVDVGGVPLGDLVADISAGKSFGSSAAPAGADEWGIIKVSAMTWGSFDSTQNKAVPEGRVDSRFEIRPGDLLVSRANTSEYVGATVLVGETRPRLLLSDKSLRLTPRPDVSPGWLWRALQAPSARRQISKLATGTKDSMRNISQGSLRSILVPSVDVEGQRRSVSAYAEVELASGGLLGHIGAQTKRSDALRRAVLAAAFDGMLTGRRTDDEAIEEMATGHPKGM